MKVFEILTAPIGASEWHWAKTALSAQFCKTLQNVVLVACFMPLPVAKRKPHCVGGFATTLRKKSAGFLELKRFFAFGSEWQKIV